VQGLRHRVRLGSEVTVGPDQVRDRAVLPTGPDGVAYTGAEGGSWTRIDGQANFWAVTFANTSVGWLVGTEGSISKITF